MSVKNSSLDICNTNLFDILLMPCPIDLCLICLIKQQVWKVSVKDRDLEILILSDINSHGKAKLGLSLFNSTEKKSVTSWN